MEKHFKNKLSQHNVSWDKNDLLENIKQELSKDKEKKRTFLWVPFFALGLSVLVFFTFKYISINEPNEISQNNNKRTTNSFFEDRFSKSTNNDDSKSIVTKSNLRSSTGEDYIGHFTKSNQKIKHDTNLNVKSNFQNKDVSTRFTKNTTVRDQAPVDMTNLTKNTTNLDRLYISTFRDGASNWFKFINDSISNTNETVSDNSKQIKYIPQISTTKVHSLKSLEIFPPTLDKPFTLISPLTPSKSPWSFSLKVEGGWVGRQRNYTTENEEFLNILQINNRQERSLFSLYTDLSLGYTFAQRWSLMTGIEYGQIHEVFNYEQVKMEEFSNPTDNVLFYFVENMDTTFVMDTAFITRTEKRVVRHYNKHVFYSIPFRLGYQFNVNKYAFTGRLGLSYTFANSYRGRANQLIEVQNHIVENPSYSLTNRIGMYAGLSIDYPFKQRGSISASVNYRRSPRISSAYKRQTHHTLTFGIGFKMNIGK